jgi:hypothetical protein
MISAAMIDFTYDARGCFDIIARTPIALVHMVSWTP